MISLNVIISRIYKFSVNIFTRLYKQNRNNYLFY